MSAFTFAFRRRTRAIRVPIVRNPTTGTAIAVPEGFIGTQNTAFAVYNPNVCAVALRGTSYTPPNPRPTVPLIVNADGGFDWVWPPNFWGVFSTQNPVFLSATCVATPIYPDLPNDGDLSPLYLWYGMGV